MSGEEKSVLERAIPPEGFGAFCGLELGDVREGYCCCRCRIEERHLNPHGFAHGGILFTLMDTAAGIAAATLGGQARGVVTQCAGIHFLHPVYPGPVTAEARVLKAGRRTALVIAEIFSEAGERMDYGDFEIFFVDKKEA